MAVMRISNDKVKYFLLGVLILLTTSYVILASFSFVFFDEKFHKQELTLIHKGDFLYKSLAVESNLSLFFREKISMNDSAFINFNEREKSHLVDVKNIAWKGKSFIYVISTAWFLIFMLILYYDYFSPKILLTTFTYSGIILIALVLFFTLVPINFFNIFESFHSLLFNNGSWIFENTDLIINIYPEEFFYDCAVRILITISIVGISMILGSLGFSYVKNNILTNKKNKK